MSDDSEGLVQYFQKMPKIKAWHIVLLGDVIGEKLKELVLPERAPVQMPPELPPISVPKPPEFIKPPLITLPEIPVPPKPITHTIDWKQKLVEFANTLLEVTVAAKLYEVMIKSPSKNFSIRFITDGLCQVDKNFEEMQAISDYLTSIDAFEDEGEYVTRLENYSWRNSAKFIITVNEPITFSQIYLKYEQFS